MKIGVIGRHAHDIEAITVALAQQARHSIVWAAGDVAGALRLCAGEPPDLLLLDLLVPGGGANATRLIMNRTPRPVLLMSGGSGDCAVAIFEAMGQGALDAVDRPDMPGGRGVRERGSAANFLRKVNEIEQRIGEGEVGQRWLAAESTPMAPARFLIAIGASAGGPAALRAVLSRLPETLPAAVVLVQHLDPRFAAGMADWLGADSRMPVRLTIDGDVPVTGQVLLAAPGDHLVLRSTGRLAFARAPEQSLYRPSVDVFFKSVATSWKKPVIGVILTGMGRDGAEGLKCLRDKGVHTIAQDQASSAVYGMPKAAVELGAAVESLPLARIAARLVELVYQDSTEHE